MKDRRIIVTLADGSADEIEAKANEFARAGLENVSSLVSLGIIRGRWSRGDLAPLLAIDGVVAIEDEEENEVI